MDGRGWLQLARWMFCVWWGVDGRAASAVCCCNPATSNHQNLSSTTRILARGNTFTMELYTISLMPNRTERPRTVFLALFEADKDTGARS